MDANGFAFNIFGRLLFAVQRMSRTQPPHTCIGLSRGAASCWPQLGMPFDVVVARGDRARGSRRPIRAIMVAHNAALKADWVAVRHPDAVVLGADTTVFLDGLAINKPRDLDEAPIHVAPAVGARAHGLHGHGRAAAFNRGSGSTRASQARSSSSRSATTVIEDYIRLVDTLDKAGAYSIQEQTEMIIAGYRGSFTNIMGLPMEATKQILTRDVLLGSNLISLRFRLMTHALTAPSPRHRPEALCVAPLAGS